MKLDLGQLVAPSEHEQLLDVSLQKSFAEIEPYLTDPGAQTSGISFRDQVLREIIYKQSDLLSTGLKLVPTINTTNIHHRVEWGTDLTGEGPIPEGANADYERTTVGRDFIFLKRFEISFLHTWEQLSMDRASETLQHNLRKAAEALAKLVDDRILEAIYQGAATNVTATDQWDNWNSVTRNIPLDIAKAESYIFANSNVQDWEMDNLAIVYPAQCRGAFNSELHDIGGSTMTWGEYLQRIGYTHMPTRQPSLYGTSSDKYGTRDSAIVMIKGPNTARFYNYSGHPKIPFVQIQETRAGISYTIRRWFEAWVVPESETTTTSYRIYRIDDVVA